MCKLLRNLFSVFTWRPRLHFAITRRHPSKLLEPTYWATVSKGSKLCEAAGRGCVEPHFLPYATQSHPFDQINESGFKRYNLRKNVLAPDIVYSF